MEQIEILDVTIIPPARKHPAIFEKFDSLEKGGSFVIYNDHDPKPLYYQMMAERGPIFEWQYLESGPESWEVLIQKTPLAGAVNAAEEKKAAAFKDYKPHSGSGK